MPREAIKSWSQIFFKSWGLPLGQCSEGYRRVLGVHDDRAAKGLLGFARTGYHVPSYPCRVKLFTHHDHQTIIIIRLS